MFKNILPMEPCRVPLTFRPVPRPRRDSGAGPQLVCSPASGCSRSGGRDRPCWAASSTSLRKTPGNGAAGGSYVPKKLATVFSHMCEPTSPPQPQRRAHNAGPSPSKPSRAFCVAFVAKGRKYGVSREHGLQAFALATPGAKYLSTCLSAVSRSHLVKCLFRYFKNSVVSLALSSKNSL